MGFLSRFFKKEKKDKDKKNEIAENPVLPRIPAQEPLSNIEKNSKYSADLKKVNIPKQKIIHDVTLNENKSNEVEYNSVKIQSIVDELIYEYNSEDAYDEQRRKLMDRFLTSLLFLQNKKRKEKKSSLEEFIKMLSIVKINKLYGQDGFDYTGFDRDGYDRKGFDIEGFNRRGFNKAGFDQNGFDTFGYNEKCLDSDALDVHGFDVFGFDKNGYDADGFNKLGVNKYGHSRNEYDEDGYLIATGFNDAGFNRYNLNFEGFDADGFNEFGFDKNGFGRDGYNKDGYDIEGYNSEGYNRIGYDRKGYNHSGFDVDGLDRNGFDFEGYDLAGYNAEGYDRDGYDREGLDRYGHNEEYNKFLNNKLEDINAISVGDILFSPIYGEMEVIFRQGNYCGFISSRLKDKPRRSTESIQVYLSQNPAKKVYTEKYGELSLFNLDNKDFAIGNGFLKEVKRYALNKTTVGTYLYFEMPNDWMRAEENFQLSEFEKESKFLREVHDYIKNYYFTALKRKIKDKVNNQLKKENPMHFLTMSHNHLYDYTEQKEYSQISGEIERKAYSGSITINGKKMYIGDHGIPEKNIIDWADKRSQYFYQHQMFLADKSIQIEQIRHYILMYDHLFMYYDAFDKNLGLQIHDELLTKVLMAHRNDKQVTNIIESIQSEQFEIIKQDMNQNLLVQGCAGSGKTMILFHRLYHVLYNNPNFSIENVILLSPTNLLVNQTDVLAKQLRVQDVAKFTVPNFILHIYKSYLDQQEGLQDVIQSINFNENIEPSYFKKDYLDSKINSVQEKIMSKKFTVYQSQKVYRALSNIKKILIGSKNDFEDLELNKVVDIYYEAINLCKNLSLNNLDVLKESLSNNVSTYNEVESLLKTIEIFEELNIFDLQPQTSKSFFGNTKSYEKRIEKCKEYIFPLRKLVRRLDLDALIQMNFKNPKDFVKYVMENSESLKRMDNERIHEILKEIVNLEQWKMDEIYYYCLDCLDERDRLDSAIKTVEYLKTSNRIGTFDYIVNDKLVGSRIDDYKKLKSIFDLFDLVHFHDTIFKHYSIRYGIQDPFEMIELYLHLEDMKCRLNAFKKGNVNRYILDIIYNEIKPDDSIYNLNNIVSYSELFAITYVLSHFLGPVTNEKLLILVDEFQDLSSEEIHLLQANMPNGIFNYYGDVLQCMNEKGTHNQDEIDKLFPDVNQYKLMVNYRNTMEITNFVNDILDSNSKMIATGVKGSVSHIHLEKNEIGDKILSHIKTNDRVAFIVKDKNSVSKTLLKQINAIDIARNKTNNIPRGKMILYSVNEAKGLEFETVLVDDRNMNINEKYVAYTRALNTLFLVKQS